MDFSLTFWLERFCRLEANTGLLSNFEVLQHLEKRGAATGGDLTAPAGGATQSECKVYEYLAGTPAGRQSAGGIDLCMEEMRSFELTKAELLQALNLRPVTAVEIHLIVEDCEERLSSSQIDHLLGVVKESLPGPPQPSGEEGEEAAGEGAEAAAAAPEGAEAGAQEEEEGAAPPG